MSDQIRVEDIISKEVKIELEAISESVQKVVDKLSALVSASKRADTELKKGAKTQGELKKGKDEVTKSTEKLTEAEKEIERIEKQLQKVIARSTEQYEEKNKQLIEAKLAEQEKNKEIKESIKLDKANENSIAKLTARNRELIRTRNQISTATKEGRDQIKNINLELDKNNKAIKENSSALEQQKGNVGNYKSALKGVGTQMLALGGITLGLAGIKKGLESVITSTKSSNDAYTESVAALSGAMDVLQKSIATLDFSNLITRMRQGAQAGREYQQAMNELGDQLRSYRLISEEARAETDMLYQDFTDVNKPISERVVIGEKLLESERNLFELRTRILGDISEEEVKVLAQKIQLSEEELKVMLRTYAVTEDLRVQATQYNKLQKEIPQTISNQIRFLQTRQEELKATGWTEETSAEATTSAHLRIINSINNTEDNIKSLSEQHVNLSKTTEDNVKIYAAMLERYPKATDEELDKVVNSMIEVARAERELASNTNRINRQLLGMKKQQSDEEIKMRQHELAEKLKIEDDYQKGLMDFHALERDARQQNIQENLSDFDRQTQERLNQLTKEYIQGRWAAEAYATEILHIHIEMSEERLEFAKQNGLDILHIETQLIALKKQLKDQEVEDWKQGEEKKRAFSEETAQHVGALMQQGAALFGAIQERELQALEARTQAQLELAGDSEMQRKAIEERHAKEVAEIRKKQAIADKAAALFGIGINTALAVTRALPNIPLSVLIGVLGGLQAATVLATPIPKFAKGVRGFEGGLATVGEEGFELIKTPDNKVGITPDTATTMMLPKGTDVFTHAESKRIIENNQLIDLSELVKEQRATRKAIGSKPNHNTIIDGDGMKFVVTKAGMRKTYINKYLRF